MKNKTTLQERMIEKEELSASNEHIIESLVKRKISVTKNPLALLIAFFSLLICFLHLFAAFNGVVEAYTLRFTHLSIILCLCFLIKPTGRKSIFEKFCIGTVWDLVCVVLTIVIAVYVLTDISNFQARLGKPTQTDVIFGCIYILLVLEAARRVVGWVMVGIGGFFLVQTLYSQFFPGFLNGPPSSPKSIVKWIWMSTEGIFSTPIGVMASYIFLFVIFGALMINTGAGKLFTNLAFAATGRMKGGPAKASVIASAIMGTVSGSAAGNVVTTGTFTIPLMKKCGFKDTFAASVEAVASTGGQIMPPVMAATAFIIAENMGVPYMKVVSAAAIPALLYFYSVFKMVDIESKKNDLKTIDKADMPDIKQEMKENGHMLVPLVVLIGMILKGFTPALSVSYSIILLLIISSLKESSRLTPIKLLSTMEDAAKSAVPIAAACAASGIIIGALKVSGLSLRLTSIITGMAGGNIWILLIFTMLCSLILGMGMPTAGVYITLSALVIPALISSGINMVAAHFFPFFYGVFSSLTPPVCLSAFAAAGIAGSEPMKTGWSAFRLGLIALILPFFFVFNPVLLWQGSAIEILKEVVFAIIGVNALGYSLTGYWNKKINIAQRVLLFATLLGFLQPMFILEICSLVVYGVLFFVNKKGAEKVNSMSVEQG